MTLKISVCSTRQLDLYLDMQMQLDGLACFQIHGLCTNNLNLKSSVFLQSSIRCDNLFTQNKTRW